MDFTWTDEDAAYRARIRAFLDRELPDNWDEIARHGPGSPEQTEFSLNFCPKLAEEGLLIPHWPEEWGGAARPPSRGAAPGPWLRRRRRRCPRPRP